MTEYQVTYFMTIPSYVVAKDAEGEVRRQLSERFEEAIDDLATATGKIQQKDYLSGWRTEEPQTREGSAEEVVTAVLAELEEAYPQSRLHELIADAVQAK